MKIGIMQPYFFPYIGYYNKPGNPQFGGEFVPDLSIIDMLMCCSKEEIQQILNEYDIL